MNIDDIIENAQLKGRVIALDAEVKCLEAVIRAHERVDCLSVTSLKKQLVEADAENARLKAEVEKWEKNTQLMGRQLNDELEQVARLKGECQARQAENSVLAVECDSLKIEVERLTKAGDDLHAFLINYIVEGRISSAYLNKLDDGWNAAKNGGQP